MICVLGSGKGAATDFKEAASEHGLPQRELATAVHHVLLHQLAEVMHRQPVFSVVCCLVRVSIKVWLRMLRLLAVCVATRLTSSTCV